MKLLLDQNISPRLVVALQKHFPGTAHVREFNLERADDGAVWDFAAREDFVIVSKDEDFHQRSFAFGAPPKVVWVRLGNCATSEIFDLLVDRVSEIAALVAHEQAAFLVVP